MPAQLELRWTFDPPALFEEPLDIEWSGACILVSDGVVQATLPLVNGETRSTLRTEVETRVVSLFDGAQLVAHAEYALHGPSVNTLDESGRRGSVVEPGTAHLRIAGHAPDLIYTNPDGTVVDTRRERIARKHRLAHAAARFSGDDAALSRILRCFRVAMTDREDELIHLYEVLETLASRFGSQSDALNALGRHKRDWSRLGELCNTLPLNQGRHRGRVIAGLRSASEDELGEACRIASSFIESYIDYLSAHP